MNLVDRILTIVITATITSAIWIVAGGSLIENATSVSQRNATRPAEAAPSPQPEQVADDGEDTANTGTPTGEPLDLDAPVAPSSEQSRQLLVPVKNIRASDLSDTYSDSRSSGSRPQVFEGSAQPR